MPTEETKPDETEEVEPVKKKKQLKPKRFFKKVRGYKRFLLFTGLTIFALLILTAIAAQVTSRPNFCPTCHYMETFYQSWRTSKHNNVDCVECHFEPGISGTVRGKLNGLVQIVNYVSASYKKRKPWAEIPDNTCARSKCHEMQALQDSVYSFKGISFNHKNHLQELKRGKTLKCTSCHSQIVQGSHIEVTPATCFNCHFKKSDDPEHKYDKLSNCTTCHDWKLKTKEQMAMYRYDHSNVVERDIPCNGCHTNTVAGNGEVGKERCFQCHFENDRLAKYDNTEFMHTTHITKHSVRCFVCHSPIQHQVQKIDPTSPPDCMSCHSNAHSYQVDLFTGSNGFGVEKNPSVMYMNGINCRGCHIFHETDKKDVKTFKAETSSCEKCHGKGYDRLIKQWETATVKRLSIINSIYKTALSGVSASNSDKKSMAENLLNQAYHNIRVVEVGKSVHNVQFADKLLMASYNLMKEALNVIGSNITIPVFESASEFIPNECFSCHSGIQEISKTIYGMKFSHNLHLVKNRITCVKCHSNTKKHGELVVTKDNCNSCHHTKVNSDDDCSKCHHIQNQVYNGNYMGKSQPDYMKSGNVSCIDCHSDAVRIKKPGNEICLKCHNNSYKDMAVDWKNDINKLIKEAEEYLKKLKENIDSEDKVVFNELKKLVNDVVSRPSLYVHNYDLLSSLFTEKIKKLKKYK
jgi:Zn ribbon nucleic-acid-binding protein